MCFASHLLQCINSALRMSGDVFAMLELMALHWICMRLQALLVVFCSAATAQAAAAAAATSSGRAPRARRDGRGRQEDLLPEDLVEREVQGNKIRAFRSTELRY
jgi:hypothetical protein